MRVREAGRCFVVDCDFRKHILSSPKSYYILTVIPRSASASHLVQFCKLALRPNRVQLPLLVLVRARSLKPRQLLLVVDLSRAVSSLPSLQQLQLPYIMGRDRTVLAVWRGRDYWERPSLR